MWGLHVEDIIKAMEHVFVIWQAYLFKAYANNVKCTNTSVCGNIIRCDELMWGIYTNIVVWHLHMN